MMRSGFTVEFGGRPSPCTSIEMACGAKPLRRHDFPFQIVADHPGLGCGDAERLHGVQIGALFRLAEAVFTLDLDVIEAVRHAKRSTLAR